MKTLFEVLQSRTIVVTKRSSERSLLIKEFYDELVLERKFDNMRRYIRINRLRGASGKIPYTPEEFKKTKDFLKPLTPRYVAIKLSHLQTGDLYYFLSICRDAKNRRGSFSKAFFGELKAR